MDSKDQEAYKIDFETFLSYTDEKEVLLQEITKDIKAREYQSLLDLGAGNGLLSIPLAQTVERYVAVEPNVNFAHLLREAGLTVITEEFPTKVDGTFDMVLSSHSIMYERELFEPFVRAAWQLVAPGGELLIVTYRGQEDDWTTFMKEVGDSPIDANRVGYNRLIMLLNELGEVKYRKVKSFVTTTTLDEMVEALAFVAGDGIPKQRAAFLEHRSRIEEYLGMHYQTTDGFAFPFWHYLITTYKA